MADTVDLTGAWRVRQAGTGDWLPAQVPGCVHTDLVAAGRIPDPLAGMNELDVLWVDEADWEYERDFEVEADFIGRRGQWLICDGLDTIAEIALNDRPVAQTGNMFRRYRFDVSGHLRRGPNRIRVVFRSPIRHGLQQSERLPYALPGTEYRWGDGRTRKVYRPYVRKAQYQFGWDWGPCLVTSGIWRGIRLVASDGPLIEYVTTRQKHERNGVQLTVQVHLLAPAEAAGRLEVGVGAADTTVPAQLTKGETVVSAEILIQSPRLWWPAGLGDQCLHSVTVRWLDGGNVEQARAETRVGLRTVELVRQPDESGETFFFRINGTDVFCKGANWVPAHPFPTTVTAERYRRLVRAAAEANMNMLRVWGGGIYEDELFYDLCDEQGIMVWQDFMFACAAYPTDEAFLGEVAAEVRHQVRRLHNHASIVLWCGDNENEWAVTSWWHQNAGDPPLRPGYDRLMAETVGPIVAAEDPERPWWPSSPSNGGQGEPNCLTRGDTHYWEVWHGDKPIEHYLEVTPRFCSEFGFQSLPSPATLARALGHDVHDLDSAAMRHRQRGEQGNRKIVEAVARLFGEPSDLDDLRYLSQLTQALALQTAVEHWRRNKPRSTGTLYWQLNDCWAAPSWAGIDCELRYKAAHYLARRFYAPLLGSLVVNGDALEVWASSDIPAEVGGRYVVEGWSLGGELQRRVEGHFRLGAQVSRCLAALPSGGLFGSAIPKEERLVRLILEASGQRHETVQVFGPYKELNLRRPTVDATVTADGSGLQVLLGTDVPALFVELSCDPIAGVFSDNHLALFPGRTACIRFTPAEQAGAADLRANLRVRCLGSS